MAISGTVLPSLKADEVKQYLEGCKTCRACYDMWRAVMEAGRREKKYRPSESAVQRAKEAFGLREVWRPFWRKTRAQLIFDSFLQRLPERVRNSMPATRQLQYRSGPLIIDIDLAKESHGPKGPILLTGQILNADKPDQRVKDFRFFLLRGKRFTPQTKSSPLSQFNFEIAEGKNWKLLFEIKEQGEACSLMGCTTCARTGNSLADLRRSNREECAGSVVHKYVPSSGVPRTDQPIAACLNATSMPAKKVGPSDAHALEDFYDGAVSVWQAPTQPL